MSTANEIELFEVGKALLAPGMCQCGCGVATPTYAQSRAGRAKHARYLTGHHRRTPPSVDSDTGCWEWRGKIDKGGYGVTQVNYKDARAHRVYYERFIGPIPEGLVLDHLCRNRRCVNPSHLEPVTSAENVRRGSLSPLTHADAAAIRARSASAAELAEEYGITANTIYSIRRGYRWAGVGDTPPVKDFGESGSRSRETNAPASACNRVSE